MPEQPHVHVLGEVLEVAALLALEGPVGERREAQHRPHDDAEVDRPAVGKLAPRLGGHLAVRRLGRPRPRAGRPVGGGVRGGARGPGHEELAPGRGGGRPERAARGDTRAGQLHRRRVVVHDVAVCELGLGMEVEDPDVAPVVDLELLLRDRRQLRDLALDADQARQVADVRLRQAVADHHGKEAVVVAHRQLGVGHVDRAHVREQVQVVGGREGLGHDLLGDLQARGLRHVGVARQRDPGRDAVGDVEVGDELALALGDEHEREPRRRRGRGVEVGRALPRQRPAADDDLGQARGEAPARSGGREGAEDLVRRQREARRDDVHPRGHLLDGPGQAADVAGQRVAAGGERRLGVRVQAERPGRQRGGH